MAACHKSSWDITFLRNIDSQPKSVLIKLQNLWNIYCWVWRISISSEKGWAARDVQPWHLQRICCYGASRQINVETDRSFSRPKTCGWRWDAAKRRITAGLQTCRFHNRTLPDVTIRRALLPSSNRRQTHQTFNATNCKTPELHHGKNNWAKNANVAYTFNTRGPPQHPSGHKYKDSAFNRVKAPWSGPFEWKFWSDGDWNQRRLHCPSHWVNNEEIRARAETL